MCSCEPEALETAGGPDGGVTAPEPPEPPSGSTALLLPDPVETVDELPGTWFQPFALPGQISVMTLGTMEGGDGAFSLYRSCGLPTCIAESGSYHAVPENPAIGFAFIILQPDGGTTPATYILDRFWRDEHGALVALQARRILLGNLVAPTFVLWKLREPSPPETLAAPPPGPAIVPNLAGVYVRPAAIAGDIGALTLTTPTWQDQRAAGSYEAAYPYCLPWCIPESGAYELTVQNSIAGTGLLRLGDRRYAVYAIWRDASSQVTALQLQRLGTSGLATGPIFTMYRQWWIDSDTEDGEATGTCGYYQNLSTYFGIRALQCGMSACWPLAGTYSYWSQYYGHLAAEVCEG